MALDIDISHYSTGTATVGANGTTVTGQGTTWTALRKGDLFGTHVGAPVRIASVNSNTSLTLAHPWPGPAQTEAPYEIQRTPYDIGYLTAIEDLLRKLGLGILPELAELPLAARKLLATDASGGLIQAELQDWAKGMLGLPGAANKLPFLDADSNAALTALTAKARAILAQADSAGVLEEIGAQPSGNYLTNNMPTSRIKGRVTAGNGAIEDLTAAQVWTLLGVAPEANIPATLTPDKAFRRGNIVGTVSQSAGVPTGAILEIGTNANGSWVRFANGFQMCWGRVNTTAQTGAGGSTTGSTSMPINFSSDPVFSVAQAATLFSGRFFVTVSAISTGGIEFNSVDNVTAGITLPVKWLAIGRWFG